MAKSRPVPRDKRGGSQRDLGEVLTHQILAERERDGLPSDHVSAPLLDPFPAGASR